MVVAVAAVATAASHEEAVAAALVHLVLRGRDIGLPRSTLPVRYSFPLLLCIIRGYPAMFVASLPFCPSFYSLFLLPASPLPFNASPLSLPHSISIIVASLLSSRRTNSSIPRNSLYHLPDPAFFLYIHITYVHLPPSVSFFFLTSVELLTVEEKHA